MSVSMYQSRVNKLRTDIASLRKKLAQEKDKEARKSKDLTNTTRSLARTKSVSTAKTKQNRVNRLMAELAKIQKSAAVLENKIASKAKDLSRCEQRLAQAQAREERNRHRIQSLRAKLSAEFPDYETPSTEEEDVDFDVFISHASMDKEDFVQPLAELLSGMGFKVWYDDFVLKAGDSLREAIDKGITKSEYGLVVLSPHFFARTKGWAERELNGLTAREVAGRRKLILPIWHNVSFEEVLEYSPTLADKYALDTEEMSLEEIAEAIAEVLPGQPDLEQDQLDVEEAERILSDPTEERIPWEVLKNESQVS